MGSGGLAEGSPLLQSWWDMSVLMLDRWWPLDPRRGPVTPGGPAAVRWPENFPATFPATRFWMVFEKTISSWPIFALVRLWAWFHQSSLFSFDHIEGVVGIDRWFRVQLNVRRMSGVRIASVCRLHARASNYRPPILLSYLTSNVMLADLTQGLCYVPK